VSDYPVIEQSVDDVAESMANNPKLWAEMFLELKEDTLALLKEREEIAKVLKALRDLMVSQGSIH